MRVHVAAQRGEVAGRQGVEPEDAGDLEAFDIELSADVLEAIDEVHHTCRNPQVTDPLGIL